MDIFENRNKRSLRRRGKNGILTCHQPWKPSLFVMTITFLTKRKSLKPFSNETNKGCKQLSESSVLSAKWKWKFHPPVSQQVDCYDEWMISAVSKQRRLLKKKIYFWWQIQCKLIWKLNCPDNTIVNLFIPFQMKGSGVVNRVTAPCFRKIQMKLLFIGGLTGQFKRLLTPVFVRLIQWHYNTGCAQLQGASAQQLWCLV